MRNGVQGVDDALIPIRPSMGVLGRRWTARILSDIGFRKIDRFNRLLRANPGLTRRLLSKRLRELEAEGIIRRRIRRTRPKEVRWALSPMGAEMLPILMGLLVFGTKWNNPYRFQGSLPDRITAESGDRDDPTPLKGRNVRRY